jgi:hypothetical protein
MPACNFDESSRQNNIESNQEALTFETSERTGETEAIFEATRPVTTSFKTISKAEKLNLGEIDEWSFNSRSKFIYFTDYGCYYPIEASSLKDEDYDDVCDDLAKHDAVYKLCLDDGNKKTILDNTKNCMFYYCNGNSIYIYKYDDDNDNGIYRLYKDDLIKLADYPDNGYISAVCFTEEYIYYSIFDEKKSAVYLMDYNGSNVEHIFDNPTKIWDMTVHNEKIWFERSYEMYQIHGLAYYDMETGNAEHLQNSQMGYINNGYMYYLNGSVYRLNLSNFDREIVIKSSDDAHLFSFDFYEDSILYSDGNSVYRHNDNENTMIFSVCDYFDSDKYYQIREIQCQDNRIFLKIVQGAFYQCIMEIDIDGNVIEIIHED